MKTYKNYIETFENCMKILENCIEIFENFGRHEDAKTQRKLDADFADYAESLATIGRTEYQGIS